MGQESILILKISFYFVYECFANVCTVPAEPEESIRALEPGVTDGCKSPGGFWKANSGSLEEQPTLLNTEPPLQT